MFPKTTRGHDAPWAKFWFCFDKDGRDSSTTSVGRRPRVVRNLLPMKSTCDHRVNSTAALEGVHRVLVKKAATVEPLLFLFL